MSNPATSLAQHPSAADRPQILLVDDDATSRRAVQLLLEGQGYGVRAFSSTGALRADAHLTTPACLIAAEPGIAVLRALRAAGWPGPALLMTATPSPDLLAGAREAGFARIVAKPLKPHLLVEAIGHVLAAPATGYPS